MPGDMAVSWRGLVQWIEWLKSSPTAAASVAQHIFDCECLGAIWHDEIIVTEVYFFFFFEASSCRSTGRHACILGCSPILVNNIKYFAVSSFFLCSRTCQDLVFPSWLTLLTQWCQHREGLPAWAMLNICEQHSAQMSLPGLPWHRRVRGKRLSVCWV